MLSSKTPRRSSPRTSVASALKRPAHPDAPVESQLASAPARARRHGRALPRSRAALLARGASALAAFSLVAVSACCRLGADEVADAGPKASADASAPPAPSSSIGASPLVPLIPSSAPSAPGEPQRDIAGAAHILIAYKGAQLATKEVTRSKEEAKRRAEEVLTKLSADKSAFADLAKQYSDDPSKIAGGAIGNFERNAMPPTFADATFALEVGGISGVVESPRGFHIIKRTR